MLATIPREIELKLRPSLYRASSLSTVTPEQAAFRQKPDFSPQIIPAGAGYLCWTQQ